MMDKNQDLNTEEIDFDELEEELQSQLDEQLLDWDMLEAEKEQIGNVEVLCNTMKAVVWEQCMNQIAIVAGEDFIEENRGLTLDLSNNAHIQTTANFSNGKLATHNNNIDYQQRYDSWINNFQKDENGNPMTVKDRRTGQEKNVLTREARGIFDKGRPTGSASVNVDHIIPVAEIIRDPAANAHMTKEEQVNFANSEVNLNLLNSAANKSKGDNSMVEWLESERDGKKPAERFQIDEEQLRYKDKVARDESQKLNIEAEEKSIKLGKKSQKDEAFRISKYAVRAVAMQLLASLVKEIISQLIKWLKKKKRSLESLLESIKLAIQSFIEKLKENLIEASETLLTTIATAILGPVVGTIKKIWGMLNQGGKSLAEAIAFFNDPANIGMPIGIKLLEVGKIVMVGLSGIGATVLGEVIEKELMLIPAFMVEIPMFGTLANIIGLFMGAIVAGIIGAIVLYLIDQIIAKTRKAAVLKGQIEKGNEIFGTQKALIGMIEDKHASKKEDFALSISDRHAEAAQTIRDSISKTNSDKKEHMEHNQEFEEMSNSLDILLGEG